MTLSDLLSKRQNYQLLNIVDMKMETPTTKTLVLEVPRHLKEQYRYTAGQFLTVRVRLGMEHFIRCYSMSSSPATDEHLHITIKRVEGGRVSNWMNDFLKPGYKVEAMPPSGGFTLVEGATRPIVALASGSGITPMMSIIKTALATTDRPARLLYANQSRDSIIFADDFAQLAAQYPDRLQVVHHVYDESGYVDPTIVGDFIGTDPDVDVYICGSRRFTGASHEAAESRGLAPERIHLELYSSDTAKDLKMGAASPEAVAKIMEHSSTEELTFALRGGQHATPYERGDSLLEAGRRASLTPPSSCLAGGCGLCMAHIADGEVEMAFNNALTPEEVEAGWVLTCQTYPLSKSVTVEFPN